MAESARGAMMNSTPTEERGGLLSYLARLGLGDADLTRVVSLLQAAQTGLPTGLEDPRPAGPASYPDTTPDKTPPPRETARDTITLYLAEEQQILKEAYQSFFNGHPTTYTINVTAGGNTGALTTPTTRAGSQRTDAVPLPVTQARDITTVRVAIAENQSQEPGARMTEL